MDLSIFLGQVISIYLIVMGLGLFINKEEILKAVREFAGANASLVFYGAIALILGLMMIFSHNIWDGTWRVIVTFVGWAVTVKGAMAMLFPKMLKDLTGAFAESPIANLTNFIGLLVVIVGAYLAFQVF